VGGEPALPGEPDDDLDGRAALLAQERDGQAVRVEHGVVLLLPALPGQRLAEVPAAVQQAHADDGDTEVGGRLEVVAGQDAQAAGVLRQRAVMPNSGEKYAMERGASGPSDWYQCSPAQYSRSSDAGGLHLPDEALVVGQLLEPLRDRAPSRATGSWSTRAQPAGSMEANSAWVSWCQNQRRFVARSPRTAIGSGSTVRTVKRRIALTGNLHGIWSGRPNGRVRRTLER
jgi:hypothetical protein